MPVDRNSGLSRSSEAFVVCLVHVELCANVEIRDHIGALVLTVLEFFGVPLSETGRLRVDRQFVVLYLQVLNRRHLTEFR